MIRRRSAAQGRRSAELHRVADEKLVRCVRTDVATRLQLGPTEDVADAPDGRPRHSVLDRPLEKLVPRDLRQPHLDVGVQLVRVERLILQAVRVPLAECPVGAPHHLDRARPLLALYTDQSCLTVSTGKNREWVATAEIPSAVTVVGIAEEDELQNA